MNRPVSILVCAAAPILACATLMTAPCGTASAATPRNCDVRLAVELTPDAAHPRDPGFLNALVADPQYQLFWITGTDTTAVVELTGPASDEQCSDGVARLGRSSHVMDVRVVEPASPD